MRFQLDDRRIAVQWPRGTEVGITRPKYQGGAQKIFHIHYGNFYPEGVWPRSNLLPGDRVGFSMTVRVEMNMNTYDEKENGYAPLAVLTGLAWQPRRHAGWRCRLVGQPIRAGWHPLYRWTARVITPTDLPGARSFMAPIPPNIPHT